MAHLSTAWNIISSCQISSHLIKIIATFIAVINSVILTGTVTDLHLCSGSTWIRFLDQIKCESLQPRKSLTLPPGSNHHIHCFNATDILFTCSDCLAFIRVREKNLHQNVHICWCVSADMKGNPPQRKMKSANLIFA